VNFSKTLLLFHDCDYHDYDEDYPDGGSGGGGGGGGGGSSSNCCCDDDNNNNNNNKRKIWKRYQENIQ
jgi:hypothetical protein